jgi:hypothetical protein
MLTLKVESDGSPEDVNQIVSLAFNTGMTVEMTLPDGSTAKATPAQVLEQQAAPAEVTPEVDEPHPVLEKEQVDIVLDGAEIQKVEEALKNLVPADPPSVEPVAEPSTEAAPAETPVEVVESTP